MKHFIVALSGASGQGYALRLLRKLAATDARISLIVSEPACMTLAEECDIKTSAHSPDLAKIFGGQIPENVTAYSPRAIGAPMASGSQPHDGMVIVPCSMASLARIAHGVADNLITRAADATLKERRKLILVTREMPLSLIHLKNMTAATEAGATVCHACPHFYHRPQTVDEVLDTVVDRVLDHLSVPIETKRWKEEAEEQGAEAGA
jgi:4-hydroxy-3-polyprenylbenzoate decarboxylase